MACDITAGRNVDCKDSLGGIKSVYIGNYVDMLNTPAWLAAGDTVSSIGDDSGPVTQNFFQFLLRPELSSMTINFMSDAASGTTFFEQTLSCTFQKLEAVDISELRLLCEGRPNIWVLDGNNKTWLLGAEHGCNVTGGSIVTGVAYGDMNGFTIDFTAKEQNPVWMGTLTTGLGTANYPLDNIDNATVTVAPT